MHFLELSINFYCVWVYLSSPHCSPAHCQLGTWSALQVKQLDPGCCGRDGFLWRCKHNTLWFPVVWLPESHSSIYFQCHWTLARSRLYSLFPGAVYWSRCSGQWLFESLLLLIQRVFFSRATQLISVIDNTCFSNKAKKSLKIKMLQN